MRFADRGYGTRQHAAKTYIPEPYPVEIRYVEPIHKEPYKRPIYYEWPDDPRLKPDTPDNVKRLSNVKKVRKPRAVQKAITVHVCECGAPISTRAKTCAPCGYKQRTDPTRYECPSCGGRKAVLSQLCMSCRYPKGTCECGKPVHGKGMCKQCYDKARRKR